jgi:hypothetical protein
MYVMGLTHFYEKCYFILFGISLFLSFSLSLFKKKLIIRFIGPIVPIYAINILSTLVNL